MANVKEGDIARYVGGLVSELNKNARVLVIEKIQLPAGHVSSDGLSWMWRCELLQPMHLYISLYNTDAGVRVHEAGYRGQFADGVLRRVDDLDDDEDIWSEAPIEGDKKIERKNVPTGA